MAVCVNPEAMIEKQGRAFKINQSKQRLIHQKHGRISPIASNCLILIQSRWVNQRRNKNEIKNTDMLLTKILIQNRLNEII